MRQDTTDKAARPERWRTLAANLGLALLSLALVAGAAELALRWVLLRNLNPFTPDPQVGYRLKRNFQGTYPRVRVRTDGHGRRVPAAFAGDATGRFLFVGDSVTFGFGVPAEQAYPALVAARLGRIEDAANAAVPGYNLAQTLATLREQLAVATPEFVVYGFVVNDLGDADHPLRYEDIDPHAARSAAGGPLARSMLVAFVQRRWRRLTLRFADPEAGAPGSVSRTPVLDYERELPRTTIAAFDEQWRRLEQLQRRTGIPFYTIVFPPREQVEGELEGDALQRFMRARCDGSPVVCLDPLPMLRAHRQEGLYNGTSRYHFNPHGHRLVADWLVPRLARTP